MQLWHAILLGIVEGITEFLPISSTGHLVVVSTLLGIPQTDFVKTFNVVIQCGAILAVILLYWKKIISSYRLFISTGLAFVPAAIIGFLLYKQIKSILIGNVWITIFALIAGGLVFLAIEYYFKTKKATTNTISNISFLRAFIIGLGQSISIIPGVSRSAASTITGMLVGLSRKDAVEFSFILAIPTIIAASGYDLLKTSYTFTSFEVLLLCVGLVTAFVSALITIKWFIQFISTNTFIPFAYYRIAIGFVFFLLLA